MLDSLQTTKRANYWLIGITLPLVALGVMFEQWYAFLIPPALFVVWLTLYRLDWAMWFVVLATPLSVTLEDLTGGSGLSVPTEPLLVLITFITLVKMFFFSEYDKRILRHPISIAIYFYLAWMGLTSITSELPLVSLKQWVSRIWFIVPYYFVLAHLFLKNDRNKEIFPLVVSRSVGHAATIYTLIRTQSVWIYQKDLYMGHVSRCLKSTLLTVPYLAMFYPAALYLAFRKSSWGINAVAILLLVILTVATVLSYTRAAWLSLVGAGLVYMVYVLKLSRTQVWSLTFLALLIAGLNYSYIASKFERNRTDSSDNLNEHVASVTNVSTDASNLERINRWNSAIRMFKDRPLLGHGPGTYMFLYAPYQKPSEKTIISTNAGNRGNAHSEYLGPMAESGID